MIRDLPEHCGTKISSVAAVRGKSKAKKRKVSDSEAEPLTAEELFAEVSDPRFKCKNTEAAKQLLDIAFTLAGTKEAFWDGYVKLVGWLDDNGVTNAMVIAADKEVYDSAPATPQMKATGGATGAVRASEAGASDSGTGESGGELRMGHMGRGRKRWRWFRKRLRH